MQHLKRGFVEITEQVYVSNVSQVIIHQKTSMATGSVYCVVCRCTQCTGPETVKENTTRAEDHEGRFLFQG